MSPIQRSLNLESLPPITEPELDELERLAQAADEQTKVGKKEYPGRPSRQRLELFLATTPAKVLRLVKAARRATDG